MQTSLSTKDTSLVQRLLGYKMECWLTHGRKEDGSLITVRGKIIDGKIKYSASPGYWKYSGEILMENRTVTLHGQGEEEWRFGSTIRCQGQYENGLLHGKARMEVEDEGFICEGVWEEGKIFIGIMHEGYGKANKIEVRFPSPLERDLTPLTFALKKLHGAWGKINHDFPSWRASFEGKLIWVCEGISLQKDGFEVDKYKIQSIGILSFERGYRFEGGFDGVEKFYNEAGKLFEVDQEKLLDAIYGKNRAWLGTRYEKTPAWCAIYSLRKFARSNREKQEVEIDNQDDLIGFKEGAETFLLHIGNIDIEGTSLIERTTKTQEKLKEGLKDFERQSRKASAGVKDHDSYEKTVYEVYYAGLDREGKQEKIKEIEDNPLLALEWYTNHVDRSIPKLADIADDILYSTPIERKTGIMDKLTAYISEKDREAHTYISGGTGSGKSELIKVLIHEYIKRPDHGSVVVIDPHGKLAEEIAHWKEFSTGDRLVYIYPRWEAGMTPVINPFEMPPLDDPDEFNIAANVLGQELTSVIEEVSQDLTSYMTNVALHSSTALLHMGGGMEELQRFMMEGESADLVQRARQIGSRRSRQFFQSRFDLDSYSSTKSGLYNRLELLLSNDPFYYATKGKSTFDLRTALDGGKVIVFNLAGMGRLAMPAFGKFLVAYMQGIALLRDANAENTPIHIFVDECQNFITKSIERILNEGRKFGIHLTLAQQQVGYGMPDSLVQSVLGNCNVVLAGRNDARSETKIAKRTRSNTEDLSGLETGKFLLYVDSKRTSTPAVTVRVSDHLLGDKNAMSTAEWRRVKAEQLRRYYRPIDEAGDEIGRTGTANEPDGFRPKY